MIEHEMSVIAEEDQIILNDEVNSSGSSPDEEEQNKKKSKMIKYTILAAIVFLGTLTVLVLTVGRDVLSGLEGAGHWLQDNKVLGIAILSIACAVTSNLSICIPIVYATTLLLAGYTHGYPAAAYTMPSTIIGSTGGFIIVKRYCKERVGRWLSKSARLSSYKRAVGRGGTRIIILIRSVPAPYGPITFLLGVCDVSVPQFLLASVFGVMRQMLHVSIGASVKNLEEIFNGKAVPKTATFIVAGVSVVLSLITAYWTKKLVDREVAQGDVQIVETEVICDPEAEVSLEAV